MSDYVGILFIAHVDKTIEDAIANIEYQLKESFGDKGYRFSIVNVLERPEEALEKGVFVTPTYLRESPAPRQKFSGNLSSTEDIKKDIISAGVWNERIPAEEH